MIHTETAAITPWFDGLCVKEPISIYLHFLFIYVCFDSDLINNSSLLSPAVSLPQSIRAQGCVTRWSALYS